MNDRLLNGFVAGLVGGGAAKAWSLFSYYVLHFSRLLMLDWIDGILLGHRHESTAEWVLGLAAVWIWLGLLGVGMAFGVRVTGSRAHLAKGIIYGLVAFYGTYFISKLIKVDAVFTMSWQTVTSDFVVAIVYGAVTACVLKRLDNLAFIE